MTLANLALAAFTLCNSARVLAYLPQIVRAARDCNRASAISLTTWNLFAASNFSTSVYAVVQLGDWTLAGVFALNTLFCLVIVGITAWKRLRRESAPASGESWKRLNRHLGWFSLRKTSYAPIPRLVGAVPSESRPDRMP
jgi:hypothetical protein